MPENSIEITKIKTNLSGIDTSPRVTDHCNFGGLLLHCTATDRNSKWHNFTSSAQYFKTEFNEAPCEKEILQWSLDRSSDIKRFKNLGAKKIWAPRRRAKMIGSPL